ncbi:MAG: hypothetical protein GX870_07750 [Candidatus Marinimicrobia bacterium]|nr:hypothetical protein [Candidatus Neomarinimicrobiota bacterium]
MKAIYLANVGNRDVKFDNQNIKVPRLSGKDYLDRFEKVAEHLTFPIITKGLECVFQDLQDIPLEQLILFYTDQDQNEVSEQHYQSDTIYFADLIEKLVNLRIPEKVKNVVKIKICHSPNDYDFTYEFFLYQLTKIENDVKPDRVYLSPAGGIPACNMNLLLQGSRIFTRRAVTLLIPENPDKPAKLQKLGDLINRENNRLIIQRLLSEYDFGGVAEVLENESDDKSKSLLALARSVQYRLYFDFQTALNYLSNVNPEVLQIAETNIANFGTVENLINTIQENFTALIKPIEPLHGNQTDFDQKNKWLELQKRLNAEVLLNVRIKWLSKQYIDFLGRIFRLQEGVLRWIFEKETGYSADSEQFPNDYPDFLKQNPDFEDYLKNESINGKNPVANRLNRGTLLLYLRFLSETHAEYQPILKQCNKLDHLSALRNKSALAHGNEPVNDCIISQIYGKNVLGNLSKLASTFGLEDHLPQIDCIRNIIIENF